MMMCTCEQLTSDTLLLLVAGLVVIYLLRLGAGDWSRLSCHRIDSLNHALVLTVCRAQDSAGLANTV